MPVAPAVVYKLWLTSNTLPSKVGVRSRYGDSNFQRHQPPRALDSVGKHSSSTRVVEEKIIMLNSSREKNEGAASVP